MCRLRMGGSIHSNGGTAVCETAYTGVRGESKSPLPDCFLDTWPPDNPSPHGPTSLFSARHWLGDISNTFLKAREKCS